MPTAYMCLYKIFACRGLSALAPKLLEICLKSTALFYIQCILTV